MKLIVKNELDFLNENDRYHIYPQYIKGEESIITKYIKINENEKYNVKLSDNSIYELNLSNYTSLHHGKKTEHTDFCGDTEKKKLVLPKTYKYFYDEEIKTLVDNFYKDDIEKYGFDFNF